MGDYVYAEKADMHCMYGLANGSSGAALQIYPSQFDECRITEFFSRYIVSLVKEIRSTSPDVKMVDEELYPLQAWKKTF